MRDTLSWSCFLLFISQFCNSCFDHDHQNYMQLHTDEEIKSCDEITLIDMLKKRKTFPSKKYFIDKIWFTKSAIKCKRTRHPMFWHDGSSISNHDHIMMMVSCMYDDGSFITDQEYQSEYGYLQNIEFIVEKPYIYLLARCPSDDAKKWYFRVKPEDWILWNWDHWCYANI